jgi:hypothetical protein
MESRHLPFGLLVASLLALGCSKAGPTKSAEEPKPAPSSGTPTPNQPGPTPTPDPAKKSAGKPIEVTAEEWGKEAAKDGAAFDQKYLGKAVRISGKVNKTFGTNAYLATGVTQPNTKDELVIVLAFGEEHGLKVGDQVVVEGEYNLLAFGGDPSCKNCRLVQKK